MMTRVGLVRIGRRHDDEGNAGGRLQRPNAVESYALGLDLAWPTRLAGGKGMRCDRPPWPALRAPSGGGCPLNSQPMVGHRTGVIKWNQ